MSVYQSPYCYSLPPAAVRAYLAQRARELDCQRRQERRRRRERIIDNGCMFMSFALILAFGIAVCVLGVLAAGAN